jgi:hypothetical protein
MEGLLARWILDTRPTPGSDIPSPLHMFLGLKQTLSSRHPGLLCLSLAPPGPLVSPDLWSFIQSSILIEDLVIAHLLPIRLKEFQAKESHCSLYLRLFCHHIVGHLLWVYYVETLCLGRWQVGIADYRQARWWTASEGVMLLSDYKCSFLLHWVSEILATGEVWLLQDRKTYHECGISCVGIICAWPIPCR